MPGTPGYSNLWRRIWPNSPPHKRSFSVTENRLKKEICWPTDLARSYRAIAKQGSDWFYRGPFAHAVEKWMKQNGGLLTADDFRNYKIELREPIITSYRDFQIVAFRRPVPAECMSPKS